MISIRAVLKTVSKLDSLRHLKALHRKAFSEKNLLITNATISLCLSSIGDILEQQYEKYCGQLNKWDLQRTSHMAVSGLSVGVICHYWYNFLDGRLPGRSIAIVVKKVVLDQLICSPIYISAFFITLGILEKKTYNETLEEMKEKAWKLYAAEWMVWPAAQFVNFLWLPTRYRVFYDNCISLGYDVYTSQVKHTDSGDVANRSKNAIGAECKA